MEREGLYTKLHLPEGLTETCAVCAILFTVGVFLTNKLEIPHTSIRIELSKRQHLWSKLLAPILACLLVLGYVPLWPVETAVITPESNNTPYCDTVKKTAAQYYTAFTARIQSEQNEKIKAELTLSAAECGEIEKYNCYIIRRDSLKLIKSFDEFENQLGP
jgi:hypothetical protein